MQTRRALLRGGGGLVALLVSLPGALARALPLPPHPPPHPPRHPRLAPVLPKGPLVMLDPGHGGKDPGTTGPDGLHEKRVTLAVASQLRRLLLAGGYRVAMTRTQDVFVPLHARVAMAERMRPALFISMHANWAKDPVLRGASAYTLASAASDSQTETLAVMENGRRRRHRRPARPYPSQSPQRRAASERLAADLVAALGHELPLLPGPARHASFVVLQATDIPSTLVEMGFLSNHADEALLRGAAGQARVAAAFKRAVDAYFAVPYGAMTSDAKMVSDAKDEVRDGASTARETPLP